jgi:hypothetical protein
LPFRALRIKPYLHLKLELLVFGRTKFSQLEVEKGTCQMEVQYLKRKYIKCDNKNTDGKF